MKRPSGPDDAAPITTDEARLLLDVFDEAKHVLLAVSGGPDSMALMGLAADVRRITGTALTVATVDHGLRAGSRDDAVHVAAAAEAFGLPCRVLAWEGDKPSSRIQERARTARYALLCHCAREVGVSHLATAHTLDDQAETVLLRLGAGSGPAGLGGMRDRVPRDGIVHLRPLLNIPKARLVATCRSRGWDFVQDPANAARHFARGRLRALMPKLTEEGIDARRLAVLARRLREADSVVDDLARRAIAACEVAPGRYAARPLLAQPPAVLHRILQRLLAPPGSTRHTRLERIERLAADLAVAAAASARLRRNLGGLLLTFDGSDLLTLGPEPPRRPAPRDR